MSRQERVFTTPIEILEVRPDGAEPAARVVVVGWRINTPVWIALAPLVAATGLAADDLPGRWLEADVNCHGRAEDLTFANITLAPDLPPGWLRPDEEGA